MLETKYFEHKKEPIDEKIKGKISTKNLFNFKAKKEIKIVDKIQKTNPNNTDLKRRKKFKTYFLY